MKNYIGKLLVSLLIINSSAFAFSLGNLVGDITSSVKEKEKAEERKKVQEEANKIAEKEKVEADKESQEYEKWLVALNLEAGDFFSTKKNKKIIGNWEQAGFTSGEAGEWVSANFTINQAYKYKKAGKTLIEAKKSENVLEEYFSNIPVKLSTPKKSDLTFAGIGKNTGFYESVEKICKVSAFKTIDTINKEDYCKKNSKYKKPSNPATYIRNYFDKYIVKGQKVILTNIQTTPLIAKSITLKGVEFKVTFEYESNRNSDVLKGMLMDGSVPMTYYTYNNKKRGNVERYVTYIHLSKIILTPIDKKSYFTQQEELVNMFMKKYPALKKTSYGYRYNPTRGENFEMSFTRHKSSIEYTFRNGSLGAKYAEQYKKKLKEELSNKNDDSDSI